MEIIELVQDCKLVKEGSEIGQDGLGNYKFTPYKYVVIDGLKKECHDGWYVVHDGTEVKKIIPEFLVKIRQEEQKHFEKTGFKTPAEYNAYLKGKEDAKKEKV